MPGLGDSLLDFLFYLSRIGETAVGHFRVDQLAIEGDFEGTAFTFDQSGLNIETFLDLFRQTGGAWLVVSNHAVLNLQARHVDHPPDGVVGRSTDARREPWTRLSDCR